MLMQKASRIDQILNPVLSLNFDNMRYVIMISDQRIAPKREIY